MGLYNFQERFVPFILDGRKTHTIRRHRRYPDKKGKRLHLFCGLRTKNSRLLMRPKCTGVESIWIEKMVCICAAKARGFAGVAGDFCTYPHGHDETAYRITVGSHRLSFDEKEQLARRDGFADFADMMAFWKAKDMLPFYGQIIHWEFPR